MKASGMFYVFEVNKRKSRKTEQDYLEVFMTDIGAENNTLGNVSENFRTYYMGEGIERDKLYNMELVVHTFSDNTFDSQILSYNVVEKFN